MINFVADVPVKAVVGSVYNPRKITPEATADLEESIRRFGMVKPLIINSENSVIVAGHQRHKAALALGLETLPCIYIRSPALQDEVRFNLLHNSIETSSAVVRLKNVTPGIYTYVQSRDIEILDRPESAGVEGTIALLISRYGEWGSVVCDEDGNVIFNAEYAYTARNMGYGVLTYTIPAAQREDFIRYMSRDYGSYSYDDLPIKTYNQTLAQLPRLSSNGNRYLKSNLYEHVVIPNISKDQRLFDLGAGRKAYVNLLRARGFEVDCYEPGYRRPGSNSFDIREIVRDIRTAQKNIAAKGLYDVTVLDSVINSIVNDEFEDIVIMTCNALTAADGVLYTATRHVRELQSIGAKKKTSGSVGSTMNIMDDKGYILSVSNGVAFKQKMHTEESYMKLLSRYFDEVELFKGAPAVRSIMCVARKPKKLDTARLEHALNEEFNIEYPGGYRHGRQGELVRVLIERVRERDGKTA